jgi:RimJ/RimL family protein N-acetyltransferase
MKTAESKHIAPFDFSCILQNEMIMLRPLIKADYYSFEKLTGDEKMWLYFTSDLSVRSELQKWVEDAVTGIRNQSRLAFTIIDKTTGSVAGSSSIGNISVRDKRAEIGWTWISKEYQGKGINDQVKKLMMEYLFETLGFERVEFKTDVLNIFARKALLRAGATEEGVLRSHTLMTHGRRRDTIYYSVLKTEWQRIRK